MPLTHAASSQAPETLADIPIASIPVAGVSDNRGSAEEVVTAVTQAGDVGDSLTVQVSGYQGSTSAKPYVLLVTVTPPPDLGACAPRPAVPAALTPLGSLPAPAATSSTLNTLLVVDSRRLQAKYPGNAQGVMSALDALALRSNLGVTGAVLDVAAVPPSSRRRTRGTQAPVAPRPRTRWHVPLRLSCRATPPRAPRRSTSCSSGATTKSRSSACPTWRRCRRERLREHVRRRPEPVLRFARVRERAQRQPLRLARADAVLRPVSLRAVAVGRTSRGDAG